ncbi:hypothetical protein OY671_000134 [Metschnikowia pulcherrima]|nr:hypothetical protein OY671_000134 [Metschnikowia pulcherrima]
MTVSPVISVRSDSPIALQGNAAWPPSFTSRSIKKYLATRFSTLFVSKNERSLYTWSEMLNPFAELKLMSGQNWGFFLMGFAAWTWDAVDFFAVTLNATAIARTLNTSVTEITWGITLVLMLRSVGALVFGYWGDRYGRKWPYIANLSLLVVLQIGTGFVHTYSQFLGVRALFGIAMGGIYGFSLATALDDAPARCRGALSGIFQEGYAFGYLLAVVFNRAITNNSPYGWRSIFWFSAGPPVLFIIWRLCLPETENHLRQRAEADKRRELCAHLKWYQLSEVTKNVFRTYWLTMIYCVLLMAGFNFMSHGSQDLYPTLLTQQLEYGHDRSTVTNSVANLGAILGGTGVAPIYLSELSPPANRALMVGLAYQLGNLVSSTSSTIESTIGERFPIVTASGEQAYDYSKVMSIFIACVFGFVLIVTFLGPENRGAGFDIGQIEDVGEDITHEEPNKVDTKNIAIVSV